MTYCKCNICNKEIKLSDAYGYTGCAVNISFYLGNYSFVGIDDHICSRECLGLYVENIKAKILSGEGPHPAEMRPLSPNMNPPIPLTPDYTDVAATKTSKPEFG